MSKITCGHCKKDVRVTQLNRVYAHKAGPGVPCIMSGAYARAAVHGTRVLPKA